MVRYNLIKYNHKFAGEEISESAIIEKIHDRAINDWCRYIFGSSKRTPEQCLKLASTIRFHHTQFDTMICDESTALRRTTSGCSKAILKTDVLRTILITATPLIKEETAKDLFSPMAIMKVPEIKSFGSMNMFPSSKEYFEKEVNTPLGKIRRLPLQVLSKSRIKESTFDARVNSRARPWDRRYQNYLGLINTFIWRNTSTDIEWEKSNESTTSTSSRKKIVKHLPKAIPGVINDDKTLEFDSDESEIYSALRNIHKIRVYANRSKQTSHAISMSNIEMHACNDLSNLNDTTKSYLMIHLESTLRCIHRKSKCDDNNYQEKSSLSDMSEAEIKMLLRSLSLHEHEPSSKEEGNDCDCCICFETMKSPVPKYLEESIVMFPCAHAICKHCLSCLFEEGRSMIRCPLCRSELTNLKDLMAFTLELIKERDRQKIDQNPPKNSQKDPVEQIIQDKLTRYRNILYDQDYTSPKAKFLKEKLLWMAQEHPGDKMVIICQDVTFSDKMNKQFKNPLIDLKGQEYKVVSYMTKGTGRRKIHLMEKFKDAEPEENTVHVLFLTFQSGALGHNLQKANHVILVHPYYSNALEFQAKCRVQRIGQEKMVYATRLSMNQTIESKLIEHNSSYKQDHDENVGSVSKVQAIQMHRNVALKLFE